MSKKYEDFIEALEKLCEEHDVELYPPIWASRILVVLDRTSRNEPLPSFIKDTTDQDQS
jgi:hypothetical protein